MSEPKSKPSEGERMAQEVREKGFLLDDSPVENFPDEEIAPEQPPPPKDAQKGDG